MLSSTMFKMEMKLLNTGTNRTVGYVSTFKNPPVYFNAKNQNNSFGYRSGRSIK